MLTNTHEFKDDIQVIREACIEAVTIFSLYTEEKFLAQLINKEDVPELA